MPTVDYAIARPYHRRPGSAVARPMLVVRVHNSPRQGTSVLALVDSGADVSMFHIDVATRIGIDLSGVRVGGVIGVGGRTSVYICPVELELEGRRFPAEVRFTSGISPTTALLGRHDVFGEFQFGFDQRAQELLIQPYR